VPHLAAQEPPPPSSGRSATEAQAMKVHSEAERRRRERINGHLAALRRMIPDARLVCMNSALLAVSEFCQKND